MLTMKKESFLQVAYKKNTGRILILRTVPGLIGFGEVDKKALKMITQFFFSTKCSRSKQGRRFSTITVVDNPSFSYEYGTGKEVFASALQGTYRSQLGIGYWYSSRIENYYRSRQ